MKEPDEARGTKGRGAAGGVESRGAGWSTPDQGGAGGMREPGGASGQMGHGGEEGARSHGGAGGSTGRGRVRASEAELREPPTTATLEDGSPAELAPHRWWAEGEQRGCQTTAVEEAGVGGRAGIFEERALEGALEAQTLECTFEEQALEGALEERSWLGPAET